MVLLFRRFDLRQNIATNFKHKAYVRFMQEIIVRSGRDGRRTASISCHWVRIEVTSDKLISTTEDFGPWLTAESWLFVVLVCLFVCLFLVALHFNSKYTGQNISYYLRTFTQLKKSVSCKISDCILPQTF